MHKARAFFYVCAGLFLLALSYHLGARNAGAQAPGNPVVGVAIDPLTTSSSDGLWVAVTANGDTYVRSSGNPWTLFNNVFGGGTPVHQESWGSVKSRYRGDRGVVPPRGAAQPTRQDP